MTVRTTSTRVEAILGNNYDSTSDLSTWITTSTLIVDRLAALDTDGVLSSAVLAEIEAYLAAHFYCLHDPLAMSKTVGKSSDTYQARSYLEAAKALDFSGNLLAILNSKKVKMAWLGLPPSEQTDYVDRD